MPEEPPDPQLCALGCDRPTCDHALIEEAHNLRRRMAIAGWVSVRLSPHTPLLHLCPECWAEYVGQYGYPPPSAQRSQDAA